MGSELSMGEVGKFNDTGDALKMHYSGQHLTLSPGPEFIKALMAARKSFAHLVKGRDNPFFKSKYADLSDLHEAVDDALEKNGFLVTHHTGFTAAGKFNLRTVLTHVSGGTIDSEYLLPQEGKAQDLAAAVTYARRVSLGALLAIPAHDDDGESMRQGEERRAQTPAKPDPGVDGKTPYPAKPTMETKPATAGKPKEYVVKQEAKKPQPQSEDNGSMWTGIPSLLVERKVEKTGTVYWEMSNGDGKILCITDPTNADLARTAVNAKKGVVVTYHANKHGKFIADDVTPLLQKG